MSTRIYNGFKFKSNNLKEILSQLKSIKDESIKICDRGITDNGIAQYIVSNKLTESGIGDITRKIKEDADKDYPRSLFTIRYKFSVVVFPDEDGFYGAHFAAFNEYEELLEPFIEDFAYWDSTDGPDDMSEEEWSARGDKWDELIPSGTFSKDGFTFKIVESDDLDETYIRQKIKVVLDKLERQNKIDQIL